MMEQAKPERQHAVSKPERTARSPVLLVSIQPVFANALRAAHTGLTQPASAGERNSPASWEGLGEGEQKKHRFIYSYKECVILSKKESERVWEKYVKDNWVNVGWWGYGSLTLLERDGSHLPKNIACEECRDKETSIPSWFEPSWFTPYKIEGTP